MTATESQSTFSLDLQHTFSDPRERVFDAWTQPDQLVQWFGSPGSKTTNAEVDLRVGGAYSLTIETAQFGLVRVFGIFREVSAPEKLVYTWCVDPSPGVPVRDSLVTVEFSARGEWTDVALRHEALPDEETRRRHNDGWNGCFEGLAGYLQAS